MTERGEHPVFGSSEDERPIDAEVPAANAEAKAELSVIPERHDEGEVRDHFPVTSNETGTIAPSVESGVASEPKEPEIDIDELMAELDPADIQRIIGEVTERNVDVPR